VHLEILPRQLEEIAAVVLQRAPRKIVEDTRESLLGQRQRGIALRVGERAGLESALGPRDARAGGWCVAA
jgi:hypothetical protein